MGELSGYISVSNKVILKRWNEGLILSDTLEMKKGKTHKKTQITLRSVFEGAVLQRWEKKEKNKKTKDYEWWQDDEQNLNRDNALEEVTKKIYCSKKLYHTLPWPKVL